MSPDRLVRSTASIGQIIAAARRDDDELDRWGMARWRPAHQTCTACADAERHCWTCDPYPEDEYLPSKSKTNAGVRYIQDPVVVPLLRSYALLEAALDERQRTEIWRCGYTVEEVCGQRLLIELQSGAVQQLRPHDGKLYGFGRCIDPDDTNLGLLDRIVSKLVWMRADIDDFLSTSNSYYPIDVSMETAIERSEEEALQRRAFHRWLEAGASLIDHIGEEATRDLFWGTAIWEAGDTTSVLGQSPVYVLVEDRTFYELEIREARPGESRFELWAEVVPHLAEVIGRIEPTHFDRTNAVDRLAHTAA